MNYWSTLWLVSVWEFQRYFKPKEQIISIVFAIIGGLGYFGFKAHKEKQSKEEIVLLVVSELPRPGSERRLGRFILKPDEGPADEAEKKVVKGEAAGLLIQKSVNSAELRTTKKVGWGAELESALTRQRQKALLSATLVPAVVMSVLNDPFKLDRRVIGRDEKSKKLGKIEAAWAVGFTALMLFGVFIGNAYLFIGITGEKQSRVTEQIVSAIPAQVWIDGKLVGLSFLAFASVLNLLFSILVFFLVGWGITGNWILPMKIADPWLMVRCLALALAGFAFWFAFFGMIAATIDNPYNSNRAAFLYFPVLPQMLAFFALSDPDAFWVRVVALLPVSSTTMLPVRQIAEVASWWEFPAAMLLLGVGIWILRTAAGRIFRLGMLMYGKEPGLSEMVRWVRET